MLVKEIIAKLKKGVTLKELKDRNVFLYLDALNDQMYLLSQDKGILSFSVNMSSIGKGKTLSFTEENLEHNNCNLFIVPNEVLEHLLDNLSSIIYNIENSLSIQKKNPKN